MKTSFEKKIKGKTILITGGTGSFGETMTQTLFSLSPKKIIIFSRDEKKQFDMRNKYNNQLLKFVIGDVRDKETVRRVIVGVDYVFHAAALKQVPSCEFFPLEAVKTNILGAFNVLQSSIDAQVKRVVILSTDKSVYPINAMGMTKALMEKCMIAEARNPASKKTILCGVRYGNVLYSRGSVIPHFISEIKKQKKLTVTHPHMTRFLLPLADAVKLVLFALAKGENGCLYVKKSPAADIETLVKAVSEIFQYKKGYEIVGTRSGEKMHETLISKQERVRVEDVGSYYKIPPESQGLDYNQYFYYGKKFNPEKIKPYTSENTTRLTLEETKKMLLGLPEMKTEINEYEK